MVSNEIQESEKSCSINWYVLQEIDEYQKLFLQIAIPGLDSQHECGIRTLREGYVCL